MKKQTTNEPTQPQKYNYNQQEVEHLKQFKKWLYHAK